MLIRIHVLYLYYLTLCIAYIIVTPCTTHIHSLVIGGSGTALFCWQSHILWSGARHWAMLPDLTEQVRNVCESSTVAR